MAPPPETGVERIATLRFDQPYAAVAIAGEGSRFTGLALFAAWVEAPVEPEDG